MLFNPGFDIQPTHHPLGFSYGANVFGPAPVNRRLDEIRGSLMEPDCDGPEIVYSITMDVGNERDRDKLLDRNLLYGAVVYASGTLGAEPVRSQGHVHAVSPSCGLSTCELYEVWEGKACIYMQERATDDPGRCYAVLAEPGEVVLVPPGWAHCTIAADTSRNMSFGAWCVRDYGFVYDGVRAHGGLAWFPVVKRDGLCFCRNNRYRTGYCEVKRPRSYTEFGIEAGKPIYQQFTEDPNRFLFVSQPQMARYADGRSKWDGFEP